MEQYEAPSQSCSKLLIDADSLFFKVCNTTDDFEQACYLFDSKVASLVSFIELVTGRNYEYIVYFQERVKNFRKDLEPSYKENRKNPLPPNFNELKDWVKKYHPVKIANETKETDDLIAEDADDACCIAYIDKDLKQIFEAGLHVNYNSMHVYKINRDEALYNFYTQMIVGDTADNIKGIAGRGPKYAQKLFENTDRYFYLTLKEYIKSYGTQEGWKRFRLNYKLLRLGNLSFIGD